MSEILHFPTLQERSWPEMEREIRSGLSRLNAPHRMVDWIIADMKPRFLEGQNVGRVSVEVEPQCLAAVRTLFEQLRAFYKKFCVDMFGQLLLLEAELYQAKLLAPEPSPPDGQGPRAAWARNRAAVSQEARGAFRPPHPQRATPQRES
jgi:hypothetical protein